MLFIWYLYQNITYNHCFTTTCVCKNIIASMTSNKIWHSRCNFKNHIIKYVSGHFLFVTDDNGKGKYLKHTTPPPPTHTHPTHPPPPYPPHTKLFKLVFKFNISWYLADFCQGLKICLLMTETYTFMKIFSKFATWFHKSIQRDIKWAVKQFCTKISDIIKRCLKQYTAK